MTSAIRVAVIEDDATLRRVLTKELTNSGFVARAVGAAAQAADLIREFSPHVAVLDLKLPDGNGLDVLTEVRAIAPDLQVVVLTGHGAVPDAVEAMRRGAYDFLTKPTRLEVLEETLRRAAEKSELLLENRRLRRAAASHEDPYGIVGDSASMRELKRLISRIGPTEESVLIEGESGTGKELVARNLHLHSERRERAWVVVNCGAIPEELVERELFGHERGAFTGADRRQIGLFEAAHGGTLFLDEVGDLPLAIQPTLLRFLQFGEIRPVGSTKTKAVDVRVLAATHRDLAEEIESERFREDLFYRLATFRIELPPLRARGGDLQLLAKWLLADIGNKSGRTLQLNERALAYLGEHSWPGNIRELLNVMIRVSVLASGETVSRADVAQALLGSQATRSSRLPTVRLRELEELAIRQALERCDGNKALAAEELGISLRTLYNKVKTYNSGDEGDSPL